MAIERVKFEAYLAGQGAWQGSRCSGARQNKDGDVIAAAIALSVLKNLCFAASVQDLKEEDIEVYMNSFLEASGVQQAESTMGMTYYRRSPFDTYA